MVDAPTAITGNAGTMQMSTKPTDNIALDATRESSARGDALSGSMSETDTYDAIGVGGAGPVIPASATAKLAVELSSTSSDVISSMKVMPPPIDIEAVDRVKQAIANDSYPIDLDKISAKLVQAYEDLGPPPMDI
jgi:negative regulator of flagellin synthesis FlgM